MLGHSKGGAEAAATDTNSIIFNPATGNLFAYGLSSSTYTADMVAYIVEGEILNNIFGGISSPTDSVAWWKIISRITNSVDNHGMDAVI